MVLKYYFMIRRRRKDKKPSRLLEHGRNVSLDYDSIGGASARFRSGPGSSASLSDPLIITRAIFCWSRGVLHRSSQSLHVKCKSRIIMWINVFFHNPYTATICLFMSLFLMENLKNYYVLFQDYSFSKAVFGPSSCSSCYFICHCVTRKSVWWCCQKARGQPLLFCCCHFKPSQAISLKTKTKLQHKQLIGCKVLYYFGFSSLPTT